MRSFHLLALAAALTAATAACGGDGGNGPSNNTPPTASFTAPTCTVGVACTFTDASTDADGSIASRAWTFQDGNPATSTQAQQAVTFASAGSKNVTLTVTDNGGATGSVTNAVTVNPPGNQPPAASFTFNCSSQDCDFTNTSTDADGTIVSYAWNFGEPSSGASNTATTKDASHTYTVTELTTFTVSLTVTDDDGVSSTTTNDIAVAPPASLSCGSTPDCDLTLDAASKVTVTLVSSDCELHGNTFKVTITSPGQSPVDETLFTDGCFVAPGTAFELQSAATFAAGTTITAQVVSGGSSLALPPSLRLGAGSAYPNWTLEFDDGAIGPDVDPNEPDFNDLVISIVAHP